MSDPVFTILLPVHRPPALLPYAIESVRAQEREDFELFIICDGAPAQTAECALRAAREDHRIRTLVFPKGERLGEAYRHAALLGARGSLVCEIADDDLWLPNHLAEMEKLLHRFEFGNVLHAGLLPGGEFLVYIGDLKDEETRRRMMTEKFNFFGPSVAGYRLSAYRRLPVGWSPAPADLFTDLFMWRKFLSLEGLVMGTRVAFTCIAFPTKIRKDWPIEKRREEMEVWAARIKDPLIRDDITQQVLRALLHATTNERR